MPLADLPFKWLSISRRRRYRQLESVAVLAGEEAIGGFVRGKFGLRVDRQFLAEIELRGIEIHAILFQMSFETRQRL